MNIEEIREYCLQKPGAEEFMPFGPDVVVFKNKGKMFLLLPLDTDEISFNVKCDPEKAIQLREQYTCVKPGYHMNKKHWNTVYVNDSVPAKLLKQWIDDSYSLVTGKR